MSTSVAVDDTVTGAIDSVLSYVPSSETIVSFKRIAWTVTLKFASPPDADTTTSLPDIAAVSANNELLPEFISPYVDMYAVVPSCTTSASIFPTSVLASLLTETKSFAPLYVPWAKDTSDSSAESTSVFWLTIIFPEVAAVLLSPSPNL